MQHADRVLAAARHPVSMTQCGPECRHVGDADGTLEFFDSFRIFSLRLQHPTDIVVCEREIGVHLQGLAVMTEGLIIALKVMIWQACFHVDDERHGIQIKRLLSLNYGLLLTAHEAEKLAIPLVSSGIVRVEGDRPLEL